MQTPLLLEERDTGLSILGKANLTSVNVNWQLGRTGWLIPRCPELTSSFSVNLGRFSSKTWICLLSRIYERVRPNRAGHTGEGVDRRAAMFPVVQKSGVDCSLTQGKHTWETQLQVYNRAVYKRQESDWRRNARYMIWRVIKSSGSSVWILSKSWSRSAASKRIFVVHLFLFVWMLGTLFFAARLATFSLSE